MFQNAVKKHNANTGAKKTLSQQLFSSSPPVPRDQQPRYENPHQTSKSRPLSVGSANVVKPRARPNSHSATCGTGNNGVKRSAGGLVKALSAENTFTGLASNNSQDNPILIDDASAAKKGISNAKSDVFFDENDFDSDLELDVEDPAGKGTVYYPELPQVSISTAIPPPVVYPTLPRQAPHLAHERSHTADSGYVSQLFPIGGTNIKRPSPQGKDDEPLPWSSSPLEHFRKPPNLNQFSYKPAEPVARQDIEEVARPKKKRRQLPWATTETQNDADGKDGAHTTPLPKEGKKSTYPWTTTASAIKEQQRALRQANKKSVKSTSADPEAVDSKTNRFGQRAKDKVSTVFLSDEQRHVLNLIVENKKSVFFTGAAGTGKSVLLREIIAALRKKYNKEPDRVAVTASTGLAACNVGGVTLHSFAGIGLGKEPANELAKKIKRNAKAKHRWMRTKVLIVDEISMVDGDLFDKLEELARNLRNNGRPFGGIQLVITGDFFQLPPVPDYGRIAKFAFDAATWNTSIEHTIGLHHVFRQKDPEFARMLNEMREGRLMPDSIRKFKDMNRALNFRDDMEATELFPTRAEVDAANNMRMRSLHGTTRTYEARDGGTMTDIGQRTKLLANCLAAERIELKKGAQVMLIKNIDEQLVNGSLGRVCAFMSEQTFAQYTEDEDKFTNGGAEIDDAALGRTQSKDPFGATNQLYPLVQFTMADGAVRQLLCQRESWKVELPNGEVQASRGQVPLILAWALSIHKAQGQTLERVKVNLGRVFEKGQAYVALSRATSMAGLQVLNFDPKKVMAHEKVRDFYAGLTRAENAGKKQAVSRAQRRDGMEPEDYEGIYAEDDYGDEGDVMAAYG